MPHGAQDGKVHDGSCSVILGRHELSGEIGIGSVLHVHLTGAHVLELGVVNALLRDDRTADEKDTGHLHGGLGTEKAKLTESVLAEVIETLQEALEEVNELVLNGTFVADLLVVKEPEGVALPIALSKELVETFSGLIGRVDVVRLEVEEIEGSRGESLKWVHLLLGGVFSLGLGSSGGGLGLLLLDLQDGLDALLGQSDLAENSNELRERRDAAEPGASLGGGLSEALVKDELEVEGEASGEVKIGEGARVTDEPVTSEGGVDGTHVSLDVLAGLVEGRLSDLSVAAEDGIDGGGTLLGDTRSDPGHPLVDLSTLNGVGAEESGVTAGEVLSDGGALRELALGGAEKRELVGGVDRLVVLLGASLVGVDDDLNVLACHLGDDLASLDKDVAKELSVDFL